MKRGWRLAAVMLAAVAVRVQGAEAGPLRIVTSFYPVYIATLNMAGGVPGVEVANLTEPVTGCLHDYQLRPGDLKTLAGASVLVVNGAGMESFLDQALRQVARLRTIDASEGIELLRDNPHVWVSVSLAMKQVENIAEGLARADPPHAEAYRRNAKAYVTELEGLRTRMHDALEDAKSRNIVTFHEAFPYFAKEFGLNIVAVVEREPGSEPSAREMAETIETVRRAGVTALFAEPQYPVKAAEAIARETGARVYMLDPAVTGPMEPDAYLRIMERNLEVLKHALGD